ncbi:hypothetical protein B0H14DRAFT_2820280 [Mycena olivaceomarginata]|nr:hypothetical protein B0H14DRAFT_2820280 [Mycena olivaceomarginata]
MAAVPSPPQPFSSTQSPCTSSPLPSHRCRTTCFDLPLPTVLQTPPCTPPPLALPHAAALSQLFSHMDSLPACDQVHTLTCLGLEAAERWKEMKYARLPFLFLTVPSLPSNPRSAAHTPSASYLVPILMLCLFSICAVAFSGVHCTKNSSLSHDITLLRHTSGAPLASPRMVSVHAPARLHPLPA